MTDIVKNRGRLAVLMSRKSKQRNKRAGNKSNKKGNVGRSKKTLKRKKRFRPMELTSYILFAIGGLLILYADVFIHLSRDIQLWTNCGAAVLICVGIFAHVQDRLWEKDIKPSQENAAERLPQIKPEGKIEALTPGDGPMPIRKMRRPPFMTDALAAALGQKEDKPFQETVYIPQSAIRVYLGDAALTWSDGFPYRIVKQADEDMVFLERDETGVYFTAKFFDENGKNVCFIKRNILQPSFGNAHISWDGTHHITITTDAARVIDINYINPNAIYITGDFFTRNKYHVIIREDGVKIADSGWTTGGGVFHMASGEGKSLIWIEPPKGRENDAFWAWPPSESMANPPETKPADMSPKAAATVPNQLPERERGIRDAKTPYAYIEKAELERKDEFKFNIILHMANDGKTAAKNLVFKNRFFIKDDEAAEYFRQLEIHGKSGGAMRLSLAAESSYPNDLPHSDTLTAIPSNVFVDTLNMADGNGKLAIRMKESMQVVGIVFYEDELHERWFRRYWYRTNGNKFDAGSPAREMNAVQTPEPIRIETR